MNADAKKENNSNPLSSRILLVEDHPAERLRLEAMLVKIGYTVKSAQQGLQALELLEIEPFDIILSDWNMPKLDGLNLCRKIREDEKYGHPYFIMLTGFDSKSDLVAGMDAGADDFISKPFNAEELRVRLQAGHRIQLLKNQLQQNNVNLESANNRMKASDQLLQQDLNIAAYMQKAMLPRQTSLFPNWSMSTLYRPASQVSGDAFNVFKLTPNQLGFYHMDVSGHGVSAAMLSFALARFLGAGEGAIDRVPPEHIAEQFPAEVINQLNQRFQSEQLRTPYFTIVYGVIDVTTGMGSMCQAGHPHPLILREKGEIERLGKGGFPVGALEEADYVHTAFQLSPGDRLMVYSDGVTESMNPKGQPLGEQQLLTVIKKTSHLPGDQCLQVLGNVLTKWQGSDAQADDISAILITFQADGIV